MNLRTAIIETYTERFEDDASYLNGKMNKIDKCETTQDLIYFCMNLDNIGFDMVSDKIDFNDFKRFIFNFRSLDQVGTFH